ncbi:hypothetical protein I4F81_009347 [Pyropia yezoensis]|uniref:Uncharacterized protein n=1 Tax=Pyropia yezoensis TaxID=2788 RepID=A0ACC3C9D4_PYRYE|nr:hypothetical protein I4F81_009347 [Neopyropia yezoensis]
MFKEDHTIPGVPPSVALRWDGDCIIHGRVPCDGNPEGAIVGVTPAGYDSPLVAAALPSPPDIRRLLRSSKVRSAKATWSTALGVELDTLVCGPRRPWGPDTWAAFGDAGLTLPAGAGEPRLPAGRQGAVVFNHTAVLCMHRRAPPEANADADGGGRQRDRGSE